jgi:hypothetical protein
MDDVLISKIRDQTKKENVNNITRTKAYLNFYIEYPEIEWAFLASMVSRNAGWNMTDLITETFRELLPANMAHYLFQTYERANWFIFSDAYPQLLIYHYSKVNRRPFFHLLRFFHISTFMHDEWFHFWKFGDKTRLRTALIINEQNIIQKPVIEEPFFKIRVFHSIPYILQERLRLNSVLFPTTNGQLYGLFIHQFTKVSARIHIGKQLAKILFHPGYFHQFYQFAMNVPPTGSRLEYEQFFLEPMIENTPLESHFSNVKHENKVHFDWYNGKSIPKKWWEEVKIQPKNIREVFYRRRSFLKKAAAIKKRIWNEKDL